jgi:hypothetical protein
MKLGAARLAWSKGVSPGVIEALLDLETEREPNS